MKSDGKDEYDIKKMVINKIRKTRVTDLIN
jgi:hypothetical protein